MFWLATSLKPSSSRDLYAKLDQSEKRIPELEKYMSRIYENLIHGVITGKRCNLLSEGFESEMEELEEEIIELKKSLKTTERNN